MKNRIVILLLLLSTLNPILSAAPVDTRQTKEIAEILTRMVRREVNCAPVKVDRIEVAGRRVKIYASESLTYYPFRENNVRAMKDSVRMCLPASMRKYEIDIYAKKLDIEKLIPAAFRKTGYDGKAKPFVNRSDKPLVERLSSPNKPERGLAGRHVALWQSHGRYFDQKQDRWRWQRVCLWQTCEDMYTLSYVLPYLVPMLENAGANVLLPRERDTNPIEIIVDNDRNIATGSRYIETDGLRTWRDAGTGFAHLSGVYSSERNPFGEGTLRSVRTVTEGDKASSADWSTDIPKTGEYGVYVSYKTLPNSPADARYTVSHMGGRSEFAVNQTMGGGTWIYLGRFMLSEGQNVKIVSLSNISTSGDKVVSADAVKIGGGYGNIARTVCDSLRIVGREYSEETSGYPRFCEGARYWLQWAGFPQSVYSPKNGGDDYKDDFMSRALWVNYLMGGSERLPRQTGLGIPIDMALAFHSDSGLRSDDEIIGTLGIFCTRDGNGRFDGGADRYLSRELTDAVMSQIVADVRRTYEPEWTRRAMWNRSYYEARVPAAPTMLLELLSHQNFADMRYGNDPRFKFLISRAVYKGILKYIASQYGYMPVVQPLPVAGFAVELDGDNASLSWRPVRDTLESSAVPTGYIVYTRIDNGGFDNGRIVKQAGYTAKQERGHIYSYKVTAVNAGGESFPSEILAACRVENEKGCMLVINGFDRISAPLSVRDESFIGFCNDLDSGVPYMDDVSFIGMQTAFEYSATDIITPYDEPGASDSGYAAETVGGNRFDYPAMHGRSIVRAGYSFCSSSAEAVGSGRVNMKHYLLADLILGKQRSVTMGRGVSGYEFKTFTPELQQTIADFASQGGSIFVSGSYVVTDLWSSENSTDEDRDFARRTLHYEYAGEGPSVARGKAMTIASEADFTRREYAFNMDISPDCYTVEDPDVLRPCGEGAFALMRYSSDGRVAGVGYGGNTKTVVIGFPFETVSSPTARDRLMRDILDFFEPKK